MLANRTQDVAHARTLLTRAQAAAAGREAAAASKARDALAAQKAAAVAEAAKFQSEGEFVAHKAMQMRSAMEAQAEEVDRLTQQAKDAQAAAKKAAAQVAAAKAAAAQEATREQAAQGQLSDAQSAVQSERAAVAKGEEEKKMLRGLMATAHREQEQEAARADSLSAQAGALQRQLAAANANATRWKAAVAELTAEKKASAQDSDQFFETAAKMQNKNDELTAQLAQQGAALQTAQQHLRGMAQQLAASDKSAKFTEGQLLEKIQGKDAQLRQEAQLLAAAQENERRYAAQVKLLQPHNKFPRAAAKKVPAPRALARSWLPARGSRPRLRS